jgi:K+-sensing histidine kinase KdpD
VRWRPTGASRHRPRVTAPSLSLPVGVRVAVGRLLPRRRPLVPRSLDRAWTLLAALAIVLLSELVNGGQRIALDPSVPLSAAVLLVAGVAGTRVGAVTAVIAVAYVLLFNTRPQAVAIDGNGLRVLSFALAVPVAAVLVGRMRDRLDEGARAAEAMRALVERARPFADEITRSKREELPRLIVTRAAAVAGADMAVLTIVDRQTGRHVVRAVHGSRTPIGVEVVPGSRCATRERLSRVATKVVARAALGSSRASARGPLPSRRVARRHVARRRP